MCMCSLVARNSIVRSPLKLIFSFSSPPLCNSFSLEWSSSRWDWEKIAKKNMEMSYGEDIIVVSSSCCCSLLMEGERKRNVTEASFFSWERDFFGASPFSLCCYISKSVNFSLSKVKDVNAMKSTNFQPTLHNGRGKRISILLSRLDIDERWI